MLIFGHAGSPIPDFLLAVKNEASQAWRF